MKRKTVFGCLCAFRSVCQCETQAAGKAAGYDVSAVVFGVPQLFLVFLVRLFFGVPVVLEFSFFQVTLEELQEVM